MNLDVKTMAYVSDQTRVSARETSLEIVVKQVPINSNTGQASAGFHQGPYVCPLPKLSSLLYKAPLAIASNLSRKVHNPANLMAQPNFYKSNYYFLQK